MAAINVQLAATNAIRREGDGRITLQKFDGQGLEFQSEAEFRQFIIANAADPNSETAKNAALAMLLGHLLAKDPLMDNLSDWNAKKVTVDVEQAVPTNVFKVV